MEKQKPSLKVAPVPKEFLEMLEARFPDRAPELSDSLDAIRFKSGQVSVVRWLKHQFDLQNQNILEK